MFKYVITLTVAFAMLFTASHAFAHSRGIANAFFTDEPPVIDGRADDPQWQDADSRLLLEAVVDRLLSRGWRVGNVDVTVICQKPRLADHVQDMREIMAASLGVDWDAVSVKATTTERLGFCGRGEGIAATAVTLIERLQDQAGQ